MKDNIRHALYFSTVLTYIQFSCNCVSSFNLKPVIMLVLLIHHLLPHEAHMGVARTARYC